MTTRPAVERRRPWWWPRPWWAVVILALLYVALSTGPAVFEQIEGQYAGAAREMLDRPGDFQPSTCGQLWRGHALVPTNDGVPRLQKPPLVYWLLMGSLRLLGTNEFAARLPNALATTLWFAGVYALGCRLGGPRLGGTATLILGTMAGTFVFSHLVMPEPFLAAALTWTFWCFASALRQPERAVRWMTLAWGCMALGCLVKGLHGASYPLAVAAVAAWRWPESRPAWRALGRPGGVALFLGMLLPWYVAMEIYFPGFLRDHFWNEQVGHVLDRRWPPDSGRVSLGVFALEHLVFFLPWTLFLPTAWLHSRRRPSPRSGRAQNAGTPDGREQALQWLPGIWFGVTLLSVVPSSLQDYYTMTAWGAAALWLARPWAAQTDGKTTPLLPRWSTAGPGWALAGLGAAALLGGWWFGAHHVAVDAAAVPRVTAGERDSIVHTVADFPAERWRELLPLLGITAGTLLAGGLAAGTLAVRGRRGAVVPTVAAAMAIVLATAGAWDGGDGRRDFPQTHRFGHQRAGYPGGERRLPGPAGGQPEFVLLPGPEGVLGGGRADARVCPARARDRPGVVSGAGGIHLALVRPGWPAGVFNLRRRGLARMATNAGTHLHAGHAACTERDPGGAAQPARGAGGPPGSVAQALKTRGPVRPVAPGGSKSLCPYAPTHSRPR